MTYALRWAAMRAILMEATGWQWEITGSQGHLFWKGDYYYTKNGDLYTKELGFSRGLLPPYK